MTPIATALRELIAAGITGDALVAAVERIELANKPQRSPAAIRQARYRERLALRNVTSQHNVTSRYVTSEEPSVTGDVTLRNGDADIYTKKEEDKRRKKVSIPFPQNWLPNDAGLALAREQGLDDQKIKLEIHRFEDYAKAHNRRYVDWQAAWRNWVTSPYQQKANGHGKQKQSLVEIGRDLAERARAAELAAGIRREDDTIGSD